MTRRTHNTIDKLPADLRETLTRMIVDNEWPADFDFSVGPAYPGSQGKAGTPRYEDLREYCRQKGFTISLSAVGRFGMRMRTIARMKNAGLIARETMAGLTAEDAPKTQKAAAEMATALALEFMASHDSYNSKQIKEICQAIRDCTQVSIKADQYIRGEAEKKAKKADTAITSLAKKKKIDPEVLKQIREQVYGIVK